MQLYLTVALLLLVLRLPMLLSGSPLPREPQLAHPQQRRVVFAKASRQPIAVALPLETTSIIRRGPMGGAGWGGVQVRLGVHLAERPGAACGQESICQMRGSFNKSDQSGSESHGDRSV